MYDYYLVIVVLVDFNEPYSFGGVTLDVAPAASDRPPASETLIAVN